MSEAFLLAVMTHLEELGRTPPGEDGYAWWVARLLFRVEEEIERAVREEQERLLRPSAN